MQKTITSHFPIKHPAVLTVSSVLIAVSSLVFAFHLPVRPFALTWIIAFVFGLLSLHALWRTRLKYREFVAFGVLAALFDLSLILGIHIHTTEGLVYSGTIQDSYITAYTPWDFVAYLAMLPFILLCFLGLYAFLRKDRPFREQSALFANRPPSYRVSWPLVAIMATVLFLCWLPYLITYYPGFVFGDTVHSLNQVLGTEPWSNNHPVLYTALVGMCLNAAHAFGLDNTTGCAIYSIVQMSVLSLGCAYIAFWVISRARLRTVWGILISLGFGLSPYMGSMSIAMWKDPLFSLATALFSLMLIDFALARGNANSLGKLWLPRLFAIGFLMAFTRNNGVYCLMAAMAFLAAWILFWRSAENRGIILRALCTVCATVTIYYVVTGPGFSILGIEKGDAADSLGIPLGQMARVVATDGEMTESDKNYMDALLPLDMYETLYSPACIDSLKWNEQFNQEALTEGFFEHWLSMLTKNPVVYFEAWEMQTFGYWSVNQPSVWSYQNISAGAPGTSESSAAYASTAGVDTTASFDDGSLKFRIFPKDGASIPGGIILWTLAYLSTCIILRNKTVWLVGLAPSFGIFATMLIAAPIWYWPRYVFATQLLIPVYLALFIIMACEKNGMRLQSQTPRTETLMPINNHQRKTPAPASSFQPPHFLP